VKLKLILFILSLVFNLAAQVKPTVTTKPTVHRPVPVPDDSDVQPKAGPCSATAPACNIDEITGATIPSTSPDGGAKTMPICAGGLLPQSASITQINAYIIKYKVAAGPSTCRMIQPPRCYTGQKSGPLVCTP
jgi:hypothetical protein